MKIPNKSYWAAPLLIALVSFGIWFLQPYKSGSQASVPNASHSSTPQIASQPDEPKTLAEAADVRLFIEGLPFRESPSTQKLMNNVKGILLTKDQRTILEASIHKRRATDEDIYNQPGCFIPHHFFRFYDSEGVAFAWDPLESTCRHASLSIL